MGRIKEISVALSLSAIAAIVTVTQGDAAMLQGLPALAQAAAAIDDVEQVRGGFAGFHGGGAGGFRAGGYRGGGLAEHDRGFDGNAVRRDGVTRGDVAARSTYAFHGAGVNVRPWVRQPHYGRWVGGVALGALTTVAIAGTAPSGGGNGTCWYWSNAAQTRGYWDYC